MGNSVNSVTLLGNVGKDPDIRATANGKEIGNFTLATSESWRDKVSGDLKSVSQWHKICVYDENLVKVVKNYIKKGSRVFLTGCLENRKWTNKDGVDVYSTEVVLKAFGSQIVLLDGKDDSPSAHNESKQNGYAPKSKPVVEELNDEVPF